MMHNKESGVVIVRLILLFDRKLFVEIVEVGGDIVASLCLIELAQNSHNGTNGKY